MVNNQNAQSIYCYEAASSNNYKMLDILNKGVVGLPFDASDSDGLSFAISLCVK